MRDIFLKICAVAILCAVAGLILRQARSDLSPLLRIGACVLIFGWLIPAAWEAVGEALTLWEGEGMERYATVMLRALGIAILTRICTDICRDCGETGTAGGVEMAGKVAILILCVPLMRELLGYATELLRGG